MELDETNPLEVEQEAPAIENEAPETAPDEDEGPVSLDPTDDDDAPGPAQQDNGETAGDEPERVEYAEIEINGKTYQVPAELKDGYMMHADYTRKRQADAEYNRQLQAKEQDLQRMQEVSDQELNARAELIGINQRLEQYAQVDWNAWQDDDPIAAQKGWIDYQQLERKSGNISQQLNHVQAQRSEQTKQETAKRLQETRQFAEKEIKGWNPEVDAKVTEFATKTLGFPVDTLLGAYSPPVYKTIYLAWLGHQSQQRAANPAKPTQQLKPLTTVSQKTSGQSTRDPSEMSMAEYDKWAAKRFKD
jgi:hypothetical protein